MRASLGALISLIAYAVLMPAADFRAAVAKVDITPKTPQWLLGYGARQSTGVHDRLHHRVVVMDDGATQFVLVSTEVCVISPAFYDEFSQELKQETGIGPLQVWWGMTHTHSAPEVGPPGLPKVFLGDRYEHAWDREYADFIKRSLKDAIREARGKLAPARLAFGTGMASANINRRAKNTDGKVSLGMNPEGPVDRQLGLVRLEKLDGSLIGLIVNYPIHGTVLGGKNLEISGDAPGVVATYVEEKLGAPMLFLNGATGDLAPIYSVYPDVKSSHISEFKVLLGDKILATNRAIGAPTGGVSLALGEKVVELPRKPGLGWVDELNAYLRTDRSGTAMVRVPVRFLKLNRDTVLWASPLELFSEIAIEVRNRSPFPNTFYLGYVNGWLGYLPTKTAIAEGGYEPSVSPFTGVAERDFTQAVVQYIQGMPR